jgi:hypothetical protein
MAGSFNESVVPDITETIPTSISARTGQSVYVQKTTLADVAINDMGFRYAIDDANLYQRQTADYRRQQVDTSKEPGEQSLNQWWVRDQNSWHRGAGINFYEPGSVDTTEYRYNRSLGVDVWTQGQATLLKSSPSIVSATSGQGCFVASAVVSGVDVFFGVVGGTLFRHDGTTRTNYTGTAALGTRPVVTGAKVIVGATDGIWFGDVTGTVLTHQYTTATGVNVSPHWVKSRIIASQGPNLLDLTLAGSGSLDSVTPLYVHPSATFTWTSVAEAPGAILVAGYDNGYGFIYKIGLDDTVASNATPILGPPILVCDFPPGETVHSIKSYLSQYLGIGTSKGVRIGAISTTLAGIVQVQYGPLIIQTTQPVRSLSARDRFVYAGIEADLDGFSGLARIDLSQEIGDGTQRYAWAWDAQSHTTGFVQSISFLGVSDRVVYGVQGKGIFLESLTLYEPTGYILSGKVRFGTSEAKTFNLLKVRAQIPDLCGISVDTIQEDGTDEFLTRVTSAWDTSEDISLKTLSDEGQAYASIKLTIDSGGGLLTTPMLQSLQLKGTPQPKLQRQIQMPLRLVDTEQDRHGIPLGKEGSAISRLLQLEEMEQDHTTVLVTDYTNDESFIAQIQKVAFTRDTPPSRNKKNFGGILTVTVLKL